MILTNYEKNIGTVKFFKENYDSFKPLKNLIVYFNNENLILSKYVPISESIYMIIENQNGDEMHIENVLSGYGGTGPNYLAEILEIIGIERRLARNYMTFDGLNIVFDESGIVKKVKDGSYFSSRYKEKNCFLNENIKVYITEKKIYINDPQKYNIKNLFNLLSINETVKISASIGINNELVEKISSKNIFYSEKKVKLANCIIKGEKFDIILFINKEDEFSMINTIFMYLYGRTLITYDEYFKFIAYRERLIGFKEILKNIYYRYIRNDTNGGKKVSCFKRKELDGIKLDFKKVKNE